MRSLHFQKGCFVGNEVVSKTVLTNAIRQKLTRLEIRSSGMMRVLTPSSIELFQGQHHANDLLNSTIVDGQGIYPHTTFFLPSPHFLR